MKSKIVMISVNEENGKCRISVYREYQKGRHYNVALYSRIFDLVIEVCLKYFCTYNVLRYINNPKNYITNYKFYYE